MSDKQTDPNSDTQTDTANTTQTDTANATQTNTTNAAPQQTAPQQTAPADPPPTARETHTALFRAHATARLRGDTAAALTLAAQIGEPQRISHHVFLIALFTQAVYDEFGDRPDPDDLAALTERLHRRHHRRHQPQRRNPSHSDSDPDSDPGPAPGPALAAATATAPATGFVAIRAEALVRAVCGESQWFNEIPLAEQPGYMWAVMNELIDPSITDTELAQRFSDADELRTEIFRTAGEAITAAAGTEESA